MRQTVLLIALILFAALPATAKTETYILRDPKVTVTGKDLLKACQSDVSSEDTFCLGYIEGVSDIMSEVSANAGLKKEVKSYCPKDILTAAQFKRLVIDWIHAHPQYLPYSAGTSVYAALADKYPCPPLGSPQQK